MLIAVVYLQSYFLSYFARVLCCGLPTELFSFLFCQGSLLSTADQMLKLMVETLQEHCKLLSSCIHSSLGHKTLFRKKS